MVKSTRPKNTKVTKCRSTVRFLLRSILALGFIIQSWTFLNIYLKYPSMLEMEVMQPSEFDMPAFTVCNINEIRSTYFCEKYPENCETNDSSPDLCVRFPEHCRLVSSSKMVPLQNLSKFLYLSRYEQQQLGHQYNDLVASCSIETNDEQYNCNGNYLLVTPMSHFTKVPFNCFTSYSLHEMPEVMPEKKPVPMTIHLQLNLEVSEYHPSHLYRGALLSVHSPYHIPSPASEGVILNVGSTYRINVNIVEKNLLASPYKSNCTNYETQWKINGGKGPITEKMCREFCKLNASLEQYRCADRNIDYPHNETICVEGITPSSKKDINLRCGKKCSSPCKMRKYELRVQEANSGCRVNATDLSCATSVSIIFDSMEVTTFNYTPRFEPIGLLSFIGGYVGLWLGISLLSVYDFLEAQFFHFLSALALRWRHWVADIQKTTYDSNTNEEGRPSKLLFRRRVLI